MGMRGSLEPAPQIAEKNSSAKPELILSLGTPSDPHVSEIAAASFFECHAVDEVPGEVAVDDIKYVRQVP